MEVIKVYPYENLELDDLPCELWKPVFGFEERYMVSSFGRIKTLVREHINPKGGVSYFPERIRKQKIVIVNNRKLKDISYYLTINLKYNGKVKNISVGRLVYYAFVEDFDLDDLSLHINYHDRDGKNLNYQNLFLTSLSDVRLKSFANGRSESLWSVFCKPVGQFDIMGNLIRQYESIYEAAKISGFHASGIAGVATGSGHHLFKGYCWQCGKNLLLDSSKLPVRKDSRGINISLMSKAGFENVPDPLPAPLDLAIMSRFGECWLDFPGFEGLYQISNQGRIKSLKRISEGKSIKWYPETMKCLVPEMYTNKNNTTKMGCLLVTLCKNHKKKNFYVARWVYHLFVTPFDIGNPYLRVYCKDGNNLNISAGNLELRDERGSMK